MKATKLGALSALTASACCLGPAVLAAAVLLALGWRLYLTERWRCA